MNNTRAYIVAVDMGYGHERAAFPLYDISAVPEGWSKGEHMIISANNYPGIPRKDRAQWKSMQTAYEFISRMKEKIPVLGELVFHTMDYFQQIETFYPKRDLRKPTLQLKQFYRMIRRGLGKHFINELNRNPLPFVTTFFIPAFFAEEHGYKEQIYCVCTDSDVSRAWVPLNPEKSRIIYLAPTKRVKDRLLLYGVLEENIVITGFPLPKELVGDRNSLDALQHTLGERINRLDPQNVYHTKYKKIIDLYLPKNSHTMHDKGPVTVTFAIGGAGAQRSIGLDILHSLKPKIEDGSIKLNLVVGTHNSLFRYYESELMKLDLWPRMGSSVQIIYDENKFEYFKKFNTALKDTDIVWTKPSELSFFAGLGIPIIMTPPIGSQEKSNQSWLITTGAGIFEENPRYTSQWLFDWINSGQIADAAMSGFLNIPKKGTYHIEDLVLHGARTEIEDIYLL